MTAKWQYKAAYASSLVTVRDLKAENAKLRDDLEDQEGYDQMLRDRLRQQTELRVKAENENAKLREYVKWLEDLAVKNELRKPRIEEESHVND